MTAFSFPCRGICEQLVFVTYHKFLKIPGGPALGFVPREPPKKGGNTYRPKTPSTIPTPAMILAPIPMLFQPKLPRSYKPQAL